MLIGSAIPMVISSLEIFIELARLHRCVLKAAHDLHTVYLQISIHRGTVLQRSRISLKNGPIGVRILVVLARGPIYARYGLRINLTERVTINTCTWAHRVSLAPVSRVRQTALFVYRPTPVSSYLRADLYQAAFREVSRVPAVAPVSREQVRAPIWPRAGPPALAA